jgi:hypothetical protein
MKITSFKYTQNYCEENIWQLCQHHKLKDYVKNVLFISNENNSCAFHCQKSDSGESTVWWDYHVILHASNQAEDWIYDFDSTLGCPIEFKEYFRKTFPFFDGQDLKTQAHFKTIEADVFVRDFSSDRRHMKDMEGNWLFEPPSWPCISFGVKMPFADLFDFSKSSKLPILSLEEIQAGEPTED